MTELAVIENRLVQMKAVIDSNYLARAIMQIDRLGHELADEYDRLERQNVH